MSESPSAVLWAGGISVFHQGSGDGQLWYDYFDGTDWYGDTLVPNLGISGSPSTVVYNGLLYVLHQGPNNDGQLWYSSNDGTNWTADTPGEREQRIALVLVFRRRKLVPRYAGSKPGHVWLTKLCSFGANHINRLLDLVLARAQWLRHFSDHHFPQPIGSRLVLRVLLYSG